MNTRVSAGRAIPVWLAVVAPPAHACSRERVPLPWDAGSGVAPHFALGMCKDCCLAFVEKTGGVASGAANPPAYERARQREEEELALLLEGPEGAEGARRVWAEHAASPRVLLQRAASRLRKGARWGGAACLTRPCLLWLACCRGERGAR